MGLAKTGRKHLWIGLTVLAVISDSTGCSKSKKGNISSASFLAPQVIAVNPDTGTNAQGVRAVDVIVDKIILLREVHRDPVSGIVTVPDVTLKQANARINVVGKLTPTKLLIFESESKTLLTMQIDRTTDVVAKVMEKDDFLAIFHNQAQKPVIGPVVQLRSGWLLCYEQTSKSLFAVREDPDDPAKIIALLVRDQAELQSQLYPVGVKLQVTFKSMVEFDSEEKDAGTLREEVVVVPANPSISHLDRLTVEATDRTIEATFVVGSHEVPDPTPINPDNTKTVYDYFLEFKKIKDATSNTEVDVKDFVPFVIPDSPRFIIFDRAKDSTDFLVVTVHKSADPVQGVVYDTTVEVLVKQSEIAAAIQESNKGGEPLQGQLLFLSGFLHPNASLPSADPNRKPFIMLFDEATNNLFTLDYTKSATETDKLKVFTSSTMLTSRTDLHLDPELDTGTFEPLLTFATDDLVDNKLAFDSGPAEIISFNYATGQVVVVLHKRDITKVTGQGLLDVVYMEALDPPPQGDGKVLRLIDVESTSLVEVNLEYQAIPVSFPK
jgi:hypothetical protein